MVIVLWALLALFILRVLGQLLVALGLAPFLPPMQEWFSGAISYPWLLLSQVIIIVLYGKVCLDFTRGHGFFVSPRDRLGVGLLVVGSLYLTVMVIRYIIRMSLYPHERWIGGSIPIFLHWVLASFLLIVGSYHWKEGRYRLHHRENVSWVTRFWTALLWAAGGAAVVACVTLWVRLQLAPTHLARQLDIRAPEFAVRIDRGVKVPMSDGVLLVSDVYHLQRTSQTPTILVRIPLYTAMKQRLYANVIGRMWAERGYTVVIQGIRGHYGSGGTYYPLRYERKDGVDTLAWLAKQPWFDGRLGMWGGSYFGYTQWVLADQVNPGPSALMIQLCSSNFHSLFYPGGAFSLESALYWAIWSASGRAEFPEPEMLAPGFEGFPLIEADDRAGQDIAYFNDWVMHHERDSYWAEIDGEGRPESLVAPVLLMAGWYDPFLPVQLNDFIRIRRGARPEVSAASRLIIGPWSHARNVTFPGGLTTRNYRLESLAPSVAWFDQHMRRLGAAESRHAPVRIYVMGEGVWRDEQEWPLARTQYTPYYLHSAGHANTAQGDGRLLMTPPSFHEPPDEYVYDPSKPVPSAGGAMMGSRGGIARQNGVEDRPDVLVYTTPPLEESLEVTGPIQLTLYVSTSAPHTDFTAKLVDVHPDGSAYNVSEGIDRRSYQGMNQPVELQIALWPTSMVFLKGHRIRLEVSSSNYPRFDRNPNTGRPIATETHPVVATQKIYHSQDAPSRLMLPLIPKDSARSHRHPDDD
jgi:putative CocE/NonD family hydrolase